MRRNRACQRRPAIDSAAPYRARWPALTASREESLLGKCGRDVRDERRVFLVRLHLCGLFSHGHRRDWSRGGGGVQEVTELRKKSKVGD